MMCSPVNAGTTQPPLMTTRHKLLISIVREYVVKNEDPEGFVSDLLIYFPDIDEDIVDDWANDLQTFND